MAKDDSEFPASVDKFLKRKAQFVAFLLARGSEIMKPTNPWELLRFTTPEGVGVIYFNSGQAILPEHWQNGAREAWFAYRHAQAWRVCKKTSALSGGRVPKIKAALIERDGYACFYCTTKLPAEDLTLEHFIARTHNGPNHMANYVLACEACNTKVDHKTAKEKLEFALAHRLRSLALPPLTTIDLQHQGQRVADLPPGEPVRAAE